MLCSVGQGLGRVAWFWSVRLNAAVVPIQKVLIHLLAALTRLDRVLLFGVRAEEIGLALERDLRDPFAVVTALVHAVIAALVRGNEPLMALFEDGDTGPVDEAHALAARVYTGTAAALRPPLD